MQYRIEFMLDKRIIASITVEAKSPEDAEMKAAKQIKTRTKQNG